MPLFKLIKGTEVRGARNKREVFKAGDVIESEENLAAMEPERYERVPDEQAHYYRSARAQRASAAAGEEGDKYDRPTVVTTPKDNQAPAPNRLSQQADPGAKAQVSGPTAAPAAATTPAPAHAPKTTKKETWEDTYGDFNELTIEDLKEIATTEKVDLKGVSKKDDIIKALRAAQK